MERNPSTRSAGVCRATHARGVCRGCQPGGCADRLQRLEFGESGLAGHRHCDAARLHFRLCADDDIENLGGSGSIFINSAGEAAEAAGNEEDKKEECEAMCQTEGKAEGQRGPEIQAPSASQRPNPNHGGSVCASPSADAGGVLDGFGDDLGAAVRTGPFAAYELPRFSFVGHGRHHVQTAEDASSARALWKAQKRCAEEGRSSGSDGDADFAWDADSDRLRSVPAFHFGWSTGRPRILAANGSLSRDRFDCV